MIQTINKMNTIDSFKIYELFMFLFGTISIVYSIIYVPTNYLPIVVYTIFLTLHCMSVYINNNRAVD